MEIVNALSVDLEDWFQAPFLDSKIKFEDWHGCVSIIEKSTSEILNVLDSNKVKITFFTLGWIAEKYPEIIKEIHKRGHKISSHGYRHQLIYQLTKQEFENDIKKSVDILENITGQKVMGYRAPAFSITKDSLWALDILLKAGIVYDSSIFPTNNFVYGISDAKRYCHVLENGLLEIPPSTACIFNFKIPMGGFYLRSFPYKFSKYLLRSENRKGNPAIIYLHPWELITDYPRMRIRWEKYFIQYFNLNSVTNKLEYLLRDFKFSTLEDVYGIAK